MVAKVPATLVFALSSASCSTLPHYDVDARIDPVSGLVESQAEISFPKQPAPRPPRIVLGGHMRVSAASAGGEHIVTAPTDRPFPNLQTLSLPSGTPISRLTVSWRGPLERASAAGQEPRGPMGRVELFLDTTWLPIADDLRPFSADAVIRGIPSEWGVVADGKATQRDGVVRVRRSAGSMDFNLVAEPRLRLRNTAGFELYAGAHDEEAVARIRQTTDRVLAHHRALFGRPQAGKVRVVLADRFTGPSYARGSFVVLKQPAGQAPHPLAAASLLAHELAHVWLPPAVAPTSEDYWLVEAIPTYLANRYVIDLGAQVTAADWDRARRAAAAMGPILGNGRASGDVIYRKGSILLADLEKQIGRPAMDRILRRLANRPPKSTADLLLVVAAIAGKVRAADFEAALRRPGYLGPQA